MYYVHPKNSTGNLPHLPRHLREKMVLDHSRLGLENKSARIFCVRQVYFTKSCQQIWVRVNQPFILFTHGTSKVKEYYDALFLSYRPQTKCSISQFFRPNCSHSKKNFQNHPYGQPVLTFDKISAKFAVYFKRVTLQHNKDFGFIFCQMCNLKKRLIRGAF